MPNIEESKYLTKAFTRVDTKQARIEFVAKKKTLYSIKFIYKKKKTTLHETEKDEIGEGKTDVPYENIVGRKTRCSKCYFSQHIASR